jgi:hypothetical protein
MLNIRITGVNANDGLILEANGQPNNGHSFAKTDEEVHWIVATNQVSYINAIKWKPIAGSTDVFSSNPPSPLNNQKKNWKGIVNSNANFSVYVYGIEWKKPDDATLKNFDPIISVNPTGFNPEKLLIALVSVLLGLFTLKLLRTKRNKK